MTSCSSYWQIGGFQPAAPRITIISRSLLGDGLRDASTHLKAAEVPDHLSSRFLLDPNVVVLIRIVRACPRPGLRGVPALAPSSSGQTVRILSGSRRGFATKHAALSARVLARSSEPDVDEHC